MLHLISRSLGKHGYLLLIAGIFYLLSALVSGYYQFKTSPNRVKKLFESYIAESEKKIHAFEADTVFYKNYKEGNVTVFSSKYANENICLFIYSYDSTGHLNLQYWNTNKTLPDKKYITKADGIFSIKQQNGYFELIKKTKVINGERLVYVGLIPLYWTYGINNKYLQSRFPLQILDKNYFPDPNGTITIHNSDGNQVVKLFKNSESGFSLEFLPLLLRIFSIIFALIWLNLLCIVISKREGWITGFTFLFCTLSILRMVSYLFPFPFSYRNFPLFDSTIYGSNFLHPSLGDLLINTILIFWIFSFIKKDALEGIRLMNPIKGTKAWIYSAFAAIVLLVVVIISAGIIRSLIVDSQISFDITNFFSLNIFSYISFLILSFNILSFFNISHIILYYFYNVLRIPKLGRYLLIIIFATAYILINHTGSITDSNIIVVLWLMLYMVIMEGRKSDIIIPLVRSPFFLLWIIFFASSISALIVYQNREINNQKRVREAEQLATEADINAQYIFNTGIADIDSSFLTANIQNLKNPSTNKAIKDSLSDKYLSINADAYDTRIYTFDEKKQPLYNDDTLSQFELIKLINKGKETIAPNLFYFEKDINVFSFIYQKSLKDSTGKFLGTIYIVGDPKKLKSQSVYPELFMQGNSKTKDINLIYAIYNKGRLIESKGDYNFLSNIPLSAYPKNLFENIKGHSSVEFRYNAGNGKLIITVYPQNVYLEFVTLFAYLFASFLLIIILYQVGRSFVVYKFKFRNLFNDLQLNIRHQIQTAIIVISLFSFIVIGISTITFYINRFTQSNRERLINSTKVLSNEIDNDEMEDKIYRSAIMNKKQSAFNLQKNLKEIAEIHNVDVNLYDLNGSLLTSTQPDIYKKQILGTIMHPKAFFKLFYQQEVQVIQEEKMGNFSFLSIYVPLYNAIGKPYAFLNVPYLNTEKELNLEISNFLVTLINLNAFIFLIAGAFSVLLTNRITNSLILIADKMKRINIAGSNEEIVWDSNDEIGALVKGYNKMVKKLEASAQALARSEREGAWREMARQVAHEIKNPLTPMKLSIQYLQKAIQEKNSDTVELSKKVTATLVEQIDQLARIASEFSQFANITKGKNELFDINQSVLSIIDLYSGNPKLIIDYLQSDVPAIINADKNQINRLFTNLFQNAIEASEHKPVIEINIDQKIINNTVLISFSDKGTGIAKDKQDKIFTPNFTTKSSGTGLGLAICKSIVENSGGKIWFETEEGKGTTFNILLPLIA